MISLLSIHRSYLPFLRPATDFGKTLTEGTSMRYWKLALGVAAILGALTATSHLARAGFVDTPSASIAPAPNASCVETGTYVIQGDMRRFRNDFPNRGGGPPGTLMTIGIHATSSQPTVPTAEVSFVYWTPAPNACGFTAILTSTNAAIVNAAVTAQSDSYVTVSVSAAGTLSNLTVANGSDYGVLTFGD